MNAPDNPLFRKEAYSNRGDRLHGDIRVAVPMSWQVITCMLLAALVVTALFLTFATYGRAERVTGSIVLDRGVAPVVPTRPGVVMAVRVREGEPVSAGAPLVDIRAEESLAAGGTAPERILEALARQDASLASQSSQLGTAATTGASRAAAQAAGLAQEIARLDQQIEVQHRLVANARKEVAASQEIARQGFISRRDMLQREEIVLTREQQLSGLQQARSAKAAALSDERRSIAQTLAQANAQRSALTSTRAELAQRRVGAQAERGYVLSAPIGGTVTALTVRAGQAVTSQQALMAVVPDNAVPRAELYVPTSAAGFLAVGQEVHLAIDAFPYQRFGTIDGVITQISSATITKTDASGAPVPVYLVTARLSRSSVMAYGKPQRLLPGMTLSARIITEKQSLFRWLFEPLFAVRNR